MCVCIAETRQASGFGREGYILQYSDPSAVGFTRRGSEREFFVYVVKKILTIPNTTLTGDFELWKIKVNNM